MHPQDGNPNMDVDGGSEIGPISITDGTWGVPGINADDCQVSEAIANIREETQHPRYPVTIEDHVSDDGDEEDSSDDDGFDWHAEMLQDDEMYADGGLCADNIINEDFEQELAGFGTIETLITSNGPTHGPHSCNIHYIT